jgi:hypothetical protein
MKTPGFTLLFRIVLGFWAVRLESFETAARQHFFVLYPLRLAAIYAMRYAPCALRVDRIDKSS